MEQSNQPSQTDLALPQDTTNSESTKIEKVSHSNGNEIEKIKNKEPNETVTSGQQQSTQLNSSQNYPKKKGGFVITSVKDSVDGDESADDLDESHASYSDISYSRNLEIDQESLTSEENINSTVQDRPVQKSNVALSKQSEGAADKQTSNQLTTAQEHSKKDAETPSQIHNQELKGHGDLAADLRHDVPASRADSSLTTEFSSSTVQASKMPTLPLTSEMLGKTSAQSNVQPNQNQTPATFKVPQSTKVPIASNASANSAASTKSSSVSGSTSKAASRVYKVVKREANVPFKREIARWTCYDYVDGQVPNHSFLAPSASDSRIQDFSQINPSFLPLSLSATSVPSSASAYSLQHSDSASSMHRDSHIYNASLTSSLSVQHSASTSSVNFDPEARRAISKLVDAESHNKTMDDRTGKIGTDQELLNSVMQSSGELSNAAETEDERAFSSALQDLSRHETISSSTNVRIDNKIEAAMDLVKKHLMLAVRDEVDELKEKIVDLQAEIDLMKSLLTPEQLGHVQSKLNKTNKTGPMTSSSQSQQVQLTHDSTTTTQQQSVHNHTSQQGGNIKQPVPINPGRMAAPASLPNQAKPVAVTQTVGSIKPNPSQVSLPPQQAAQQSAQQKQPQIRPAAYQPNSTVFQPVVQTSGQVSSQMSTQPIQVKRAYQQAPGQQGGPQPGYQSPQVVLQQPNLIPLTQQTQIPPLKTSHPPLQQLPATAQQPVTNMSQTTSTSGPVAQSQFPSTSSQTATVRVSVQGAAMPRPQPTPNPSVVTATSGPPNMQTQGTAQVQGSLSALQSNGKLSVDNKRSKT